MSLKITYKILELQGSSDNVWNIQGDDIASAFTKALQSPKFVCFDFRPKAGELLYDDFGTTWIDN